LKLRNRLGDTAVVKSRRRRLVLTRRDSHAEKIYSARVVVMDTDGTKAKEIFKAEDRSWVLMGFDWR